MFYDNYIRFCESVGKSPSAVAVENGITKSNVTYWKKGRNMPSDVTLAKLAKYFGCTLEELTAAHEENKKPALIDENGMTAKQKEAMEFIRRLSDEQLSRFIKMGEAAFEEE